MKIAFCTFVSLSCYGGTEVRLSEWVNKLVKDNHEVSVYATPYSHGGRKVNPSNIIPSIPYREAWRHKVEADVAYMYYYSPLVWKVLFNINCPVIAGLHPPGLLSKTSIRGWLFKAIGSQDLASFNAVRIQSPIFKLKSDNINVLEIPDWVDTSNYNIRKQLADKFTILFVGRRNKDRRWSTFREIVCKLKGRGYNFDFIATGEKDEAIEGLGVVNHDSMAEIYSKAHVLVQPTLTDTFGLVIVEALACGIAVITTPIIAHESLNVPLLYAYSADEFIQQILKLYNQWQNALEVYEENRQNLRNSVLKYDINIVLPQLEDMFEAVAGQESVMV